MTCQIVISFLAVTESMLSDDETNKRAAEARARGVRIRAELVAILKESGPQAATMLYAQIEGDVSLPEVAFQLERLAEEGQASGEPDGLYELP